jgi:HSP20 family protein
MFGNLLDLDTVLDDFLRMQRELGTSLSGLPPRSSIRSVARGSFPAINVGSTDDAVQVYVFAPGLDSEKLDVSIQNNLLTIVGERPTPQLEASDKAGYHMRERYSGSFRRVLTLPDDVDPERVEAKYTDGVLQIAVARRESAKARQIEVK